MKITFVSGEERKMNYVRLLTDDDISITVSGPQPLVSLDLIARTHGAAGTWR